MPVQQAIGIYKDEGKKRRWILMQYQPMATPDPEEDYVFLANRGSGCENVMSWDAFEQMLRTEGKTQLLKAASVKIETAKLVQQRPSRGRMNNAQLLEQLRAALGE